VAASAADVAALQEVVAAASRDERPQPIRVGPYHVSPPPPPSSPFSAVRHWNDLPAPLTALGVVALLAAMSFYPARGNYGR
jgi:hypothetical protein